MKKKLLYGAGLIIGLSILVWLWVFRPVGIINKPWVLGHGGMGIRSNFPLNSRASLDEALSYPIDGVEVDVVMTLDEVLIAFHDNDLSYSTECGGLVSKNNLLDLQNCENTSWSSSEPIAQLDAVLAASSTEKKIYSLDVKLNHEEASESAQSFINELVSLIEDHPEHLICVESTSVWFLSELQLYETDALLFFYTDNAGAAMEIAKANEFHGISTDLDLIDEQLVSKIHEKRLFAMVSGCGSVWDNRQAIEIGADIIQTDDVSSIVWILD